MSKGELLTGLMGFFLGFALTQSWWSGDWSWLLWSLAGLCGGAGLGLRDSARMKP